MDYDDLQGKVAWIVGATGVIGAAVARQLADHGVRLVLSGRSASTLEPLLQRMGGSPHLAIPVDATDRAAVDDAVAEIVSSCGKIDILLNSTTCPIFRAFPDLEDEDWLAVLDAKLLAYVRTCRAVIPHMIARGGGSIINVSGRGGHQPGSPSHFAGSCANGAVNTLTKALALHHGGAGLRVNAIAPGPVISERYDRIAEANAAVLDQPDAPASTVAPVGDQATPDSIADVAVFLASQRSRQFTGLVLQADGGATTSL